MNTITDDLQDVQEQKDLAFDLPDDNTQVDMQILQDQSKDNVEKTNDIVTKSGEIITEVNTHKTEIEFLKENFKQYVAGNTYNGIALTVTGTNFTLSRATFVPYRTIETSLGGDAAFRMDYEIYGTMAPVAPAIIQLTISGIAFKGIHVVRSNIIESGVAFRTVVYSAASGSLVQVNGNGNFNSVWVGGPNELASWPTWADPL